MQSHNNQYLTFTLGEEVFALDIGTVREVLELMPITRVPRTPAFLRGVANVRGSAVPVVDLRRKFGLEPAEDTVETCVIIVEVAQQGQTVVMGALVDSVREVLEMDREAMEPPPRLGLEVNTDFLRGMGRLGDGFVIVLDIDKMFSEGELTAMAADACPEVPHEQSAQAGMPA